MVVVVAGNVVVGIVFEIGVVDIVGVYRCCCCHRCYIMSCSL